MAKVQVLSLSNKHRAILEHMVANPAQKLGEIAATFDVSPSWLSVLIHSDAFQEELAKKRGEVFHPAMVSLQERLTGMAHLVLDKLGEEIDNGKLTGGQLIETSTSVLDRLGYGPDRPAGGGPTQNNYFIGAVPANVVHEARANFGRRQQEEVEDAEIVDDETDRAIQPKLAAGGDSAEGGTD